MKIFILYSNIEISFALTKNMKSQYYIKYINIQYYYIKKLINKKEFIIKQIPRSEILANKMIKKFLIKIFRKY